MFANSAQPGGWLLGRWMLLKNGVAAQLLLPTLDSTASMFCENLYAPGCAVQQPIGMFM